MHQLVRAEHPDLVANSRPGFIQITAFNKEREDTMQEDRTRYFQEKLNRQIGLRWIIEGMVGGDLSPIDPKTLEYFVEGQQEIVVQEFNKLRDELKKNQTILVGHNVFLDLIYFYKCFFGPLPARVEEFQELMHQLFPAIIDTKYLATHNSVNPGLSRSALEDLDGEFSRLPVPVIETNPEHDKYANDARAHEAGFDSFLTAKVLIRLSAKLEAAGHYVDENGFPTSEDDEYTTASEDADAASPGDEDDSGNQDISLAVAALDKATLSTAGPGNIKTKAGPGVAPRTAVSHPNAFDLLADAPAEEGPLPVSLRTAKVSGKKKAKKAKEKFTMMPPFSSHFWTVYGNKLRVNGTVEGVCVMNR